MSDKIIPLDQKCCPLKDKEPIGHEPRRIVWRSTPGNAVLDVKITDPGGFFDPGFREGDDYVIPYNGSPIPPPLLEWFYAARCDSGECTTDFAGTPPQMTNGGGG